MTAVSATRVDLSVSSHDDGPAARVRLTGDIDLAVEPALAVAVAEVQSLEPCAVLVDLTDVTLAGSSLVNFLIQVRAVIPGHASIRVLGAIPIVEQVLTVTAVDQLVGLDAPQSSRRRGRQAVSH